MRRKSPENDLVSKAQMTRRIIGVALWAAGIGAGIFGGSYGLPVALAMFVIGFFVFVSGPAKGKH